MTIEQLRKETKVYSYGIFEKGIYIGYTRRGDTKHLTLNPEECARQLSAIGSIDSWEDSTEIVINDGDCSMSWSLFYPQFQLSQWEALTLAIRHEYELSIEQDSNMMNITNAVNKLKQNG